MQSALAAEPAGAPMPKNEGPTAVSDGSDWRGFMRRHWVAVIVFVAACVLAAAVAVYVFWWYVGDAQTTGLVPAALSLWTMGTLITFILYAVFWELLFIGIPVIIGVAAAWLWWKRLPLGERSGYHFAGGPRRTGQSGGVSLLFFVAFCIKVYLDGNWSVPISTWNVNYVVGSMITILVWAAVIFGIPAAIVAIWWIRREAKKT